MGRVLIQGEIRPAFREFMFAFCEMSEHLGLGERRTFCQGPEHLVPTCGRCSLLPPACCCLASLPLAGPSAFSEILGRTPWCGKEALEIKPQVWFFSLFSPFSITNIHQDNGPRSTFCSHLARCEALADVENFI